jgi:hypothetical protein
MLRARAPDAVDTDRGTRCFNPATHNGLDEQGTPRGLV